MVVIGWLALSFAFSLLDDLLLESKLYSELPNATLLALVITAPNPILGLLLLPLLFAALFLINHIIIAGYYTFRWGRFSKFLTKYTRLNALLTLTFGLIATTITTIYLGITVNCLFGDWFNKSSRSPTGTNFGYCPDYEILVFLGKDFIRWSGESFFAGSIVINATFLMLLVIWVVRRVVRRLLKFLLDE